MSIPSRFVIPLLGASFLLPLTIAEGYTFPYGSEKVRGVSLGGWLITQPWITPTLYDSNTNDMRVTDEYTFTQYVERSVAETALKNHWDTWITESDIRDIANAGLNHIKIPIGYWAFEVAAGEPYIQGQLPYLYKAVEWARKYKLKVLVDLYGAPGSQNGFINSGHLLPYPGWHTNSTNVQRTHAIVKNLTSMFADCTDVVTIIAPLNEAPGFLGQDVVDVTKKYYKDSYEEIRNPSPGTGNGTSLFVMIHDAFLPFSAWDGFMPQTSYTGVLLDTHIYPLFRDIANQGSYEKHFQVACANATNLSNSPMMTIVGEWSTTPNTCAKYLRGRGNADALNGTIPANCTGVSGSATTFSDEFKTFLGQYFQAQVMGYEKHSAGWIHWPWKAENNDEWTYQAGLGYGWIPNKPTDYIYHDEDGKAKDFCA